MNTRTTHSTFTRRLLTLLFAAALALPLLAPPASAGTAADGPTDTVLESDVGTGVLTPAINCCGSVGQGGLRFVTASAKFDYQRNSDGTYTVEAACTGTAGYDPASVSVTCSIDSTSQTISFPGGAGTTPVVATQVYEPFEICAKTVATYILVAPMTAETCAEIDISTGQVISLISE